MYFVKIENGKITVKGSHNQDGMLPGGFTEIEESWYEKIEEVPCAVSLDANGLIIDVETISAPYLSPQVPTNEERIQALEETMNFLLGL